MRQAAHTPLRRREELSATPTAVMRGVAVHLAAALRNSLQEAPTTLLSDSHSLQVPTTLLS